MNKIKKIMAIAVCLFILVPIAVACADIKFEGKALEKGKVGEEYFADILIDNETDEDVKYSVKEGSNLPSGLTLSSDGSLSGIPTASGTFNFTLSARIGEQKPKDAEFSVEIASGELKYEDDDTLWIALNKDFPGMEGYKMVSSEIPDIKTATGHDEKAITYKLTEGTLPDGLTFNEEKGEIEGLYTNAERGDTVTFKITASAANCAPATAEFKLSFVQPKLVLQGTKLPSARVSEFYTYQITASGLDTDTDTVVEYSLAEGSKLPVGLTLESDGFLLTKESALTPESETASRVYFTVIATAPGYTSAEAVFTIAVLSAHRPEGVEPEPGKITYENKNTMLDGMYVGSSYSIKGAVTGASSSNFEPVSYHAISGLPASFHLYPTGLLYSEKVTAAVRNYQLLVEARAAGCDPVRLTFTIPILQSPLKGMNRFPGTNNAITIKLGTRGEAYSDTIAETTYGAAIVPTVVKPDDTSDGITFSSSNLPAGLSLSSNGSVTGTPQSATKSTSFSVTAKATGYSNLNFTVFISVQEAMTIVASGIFEAEFVNLDNVKGVGHSGAAQGIDMINAFSFASNGYLVNWWTTDVFEFVIESTTAVSGVTIKLALAADLTSLAMNSSNYRVSVNGTNLSFAPFTVTGADPIKSVADFTINTSVSLIAGKNIIQVQTTNLVTSNGRDGSPALDCIKLSNFGTATLSWRPLTYNLVKN